VPCLPIGCPGWGRLLPSPQCGSQISLLIFPRPSLNHIGIFAPFSHPKNKVTSIRTDTNHDKNPSLKKYRLPLTGRDRYK
jgi:hypothetical protein